MKEAKEGTFSEEEMGTLASLLIAHARRKQQRGEGMEKKNILLDSEKG